MGTVSKALSLIGFFSRARPLIGLSEMSRLSGLNKATVHRLLSEMAEQGFVEQAGTGRAYRLGPIYPRLAALREAAVPTREVAQRVLERISHETGETAHLSLVQGGRLSVVAYAYSPQHGTRVTMEDADEIGFHSTSSGLAVLAYSAQEFTEAILTGPLEQRTPLTETDPDALRRTIATVRETGISESVSGFEIDVHSHACPIFDAAQCCIGGVAVAAPISRMDEALRAHVRAVLPRSAIELTRLLGGFAPDAFLRLAAKTSGPAVQDTPPQPGHGLAASKG
ncbi:DNA-binding transcriptional regulator, IclR family [Salinihabitans flavidus]|uniref:DNA-binding transcriptional regulator, IclR family n=1 Tax=Salinihabitans flavidus TaxID=569882 RepID=A0A1H8U3H0_9RHOB|nr:IclR family transcriptional regulator [Salinihabitans flavidus]SEO97822.1 DNA-binding transcriptional regulator, IclR family [Salinihabitans flavidus]